MYIENCARRQSSPAHQMINRRNRETMLIVFALEAHMKRLYSLAIAAMVCLAFITATPSVFAQATFGNISGTVTDPAGAAIPNAQVSISDTERGSTYQTTTNTSGNYTQTHLLPGKYKILIAAAGFAEFNANAVVQVDATTRADAQMQIGKAATQVTVTVERLSVK